jgi:hypothetical protein
MVTSPLLISCLSNMFSSKKAPIDIHDIPDAWIFKYYLKLEVELTGQSEKIKSIFNPRDSNPSMCVYVNSSGLYRYKCFSTGIGGNSINLVMRLFELDYPSATAKIISDYAAQGLDRQQTAPLAVQSKWIISDYQTRSWTKTDAKFWSEYNIGSDILDRYNVRPLASYSMHRDGSEHFSLSRSMMYGYFTAKGDLYKLYQPNSEKKFFTLLPNYLQGWDQIEGKDRLFVCSSLKDIMAFKSLKIDGDCVAPQSENSQIHCFIDWIRSYPEKYIIFDNDSAGLAVMMKYKELYGVPYLHLQLSKDISDSIKDHGARTVKQELLSLLK